MLFLLFITWFNWKTIKTDNFTVIYKHDYEWEARQILYNLEFYKENVWKLTGNRYRHLPVVVEDVGTMANGYADPIFRNIHILTYPPNPGFEIDATVNWFRSVSTHEYTHICHLTKVSGVAKPFNFLFGFPFLPNLCSPLWIMEGITVLSESKDLYEGRLNDGFFDSYIGIRKDDFPSINRITHMPQEFPYQMGPYLYGGEFFSYLARYHGEKKIEEFFDSYGSYFWAPVGLLFPFIGIDLAARGSFGMDFPSLFDDWQEKNRLRFRNYLIDGSRLTDDGWFKSYMRIYNGNLYYFRRFYKKVDALKTKVFYQIVEYDIERSCERVVANLTSPLTCHIRIKDDKLYYGRMNLKKGLANLYMSGFGVTSSVHVIDLSTGKDRKLFDDDVRGFAVFPNGRILYSKDRKDRFGSELWVYYKGRKEMLFETKYLVAEIDANDKYIAVTARRDWRTWSVYLLDLDKNEFKPIANTYWVEANIALSGDRLIYTCNYDHIYNIHYYDLAEEKDYIQAGFSHYNFGCIDGDTIYYIGLNKSGLDLYKRKMKVREFEAESWLLRGAIPDFRRMDIDTAIGGYPDVFKTLFQPALHVPVILPVDTTFQKWFLGGILLGGDATAENTYLAFFGYDQLGDSVIAIGLWNSQFFTPLSINLEYYHNSQIDLGLDYPIYLSTNPGLYRVTAFINARSHDVDYSRKEFNPGLLLGFQDPLFNSDLRLGLRIERKGLESSIARTAEEFRSRSGYYLGGGEFRTILSGYHDPDNPDSIRLKIRGDEMYANTGGKLTLEYSHPLLKIRSGLWNPNIYFEDLCGQIFFDYGISEGGEYIWSTGVELKLETGLALGFLKLAPSGGIAVNKDSEIKFIWSISGLL